jgi:hypothetical protein
LVACSVKAHNQAKSNQLIAPSAFQHRDIFDALGVRGIR